MRQHNQAVAVDEELRELKLRFELLEGDRKAYHETSQGTISKNKEEINILKLNNKKLSESIVRLKKSSIAIPTNSASMTELEKFDQKICDVKKRYDELVAESKLKAKLLRNGLARLEDTKREAQMIEAYATDSREAKVPISNQEIRMLENRLDKVVIKNNEAQSIQYTYELIIKRLREERLSFDSQLKTFEQTIVAKKIDAQELDVMARDAHDAKDVAKADLSSSEQQLYEERRQRERNLIALKDMVKQRLKISSQSDRKVVKPEDLKLVTATIDVKDQYDDATEKKLLEYEGILRAIQEVTGATDISEVVGKYQAQREVHSQLTLLKFGNEQKIKELAEKKEVVIAESSKNELIGNLKKSEIQKKIDIVELSIRDSEKLCLVAKQKYERSLKVLNNANAGVQHLFDKLAGIKISELFERPSTVNSENVSESLRICVKKLETLATALNGKGLPESIQKELNQQSQMGGVSNLPNFNLSILPSHNTRVKLRPIEFEDVNVDDDDNDGDHAEVPDRESMKKHTLQLINSRLKSKQPKKAKVQKVSQDDDSN